MSPLPQFVNLFPRQRSFDEEFDEEFEKAKNNINNFGSLGIGLTVGGFLLVIGLIFTCCFIAYRRKKKGRARAAEFFARNDALAAAATADGVQVPVPADYANINHGNVGAPYQPPQSIGLMNMGAGQQYPQPQPQQYQQSQQQQPYEQTQQTQQYQQPQQQQPSVPQQQQYGPSPQPLQSPQQQYEQPPPMYSPKAT